MATKTTRRKPRTIVRIQWSGADVAWLVRDGKTVIVARPRQDDAIAEGVAYARELFARGDHAQLVVHGRAGQFRWERTYGADPRRRIG